MTMDLMEFPLARWMEQRSERRNWHYEGTTRTSYIVGPGTTSDPYFKRYASACIISSGFRLFSDMQSKDNEGNVTEAGNPILSQKLEWFPHCNNNGLFNDSHNYRGYISVAGVPEFCSAVLLHASKATDMSLPHLSTLNAIGLGRDQTGNFEYRRPALYRLRYPGRLLIMKRIKYQRTTRSTERWLRSRCNYNIDRLPNELLILIFSYLDVRELSASVALVCKLWYELAQSPVLWRRLRFDGKGLTTDTAKALLKKAPILKELILSDR
ncbi:hypothetical protein ANN_18716 [Periplaneta americana]|uniref:F-box domain-containing protein n=1 Tax=Periplaneta americana TaxID=6978 RepID=A0ABQ8SPI2_PERAM|nr:hypothetical protein ANN_18716 [Periplaneta americana]